MPDNQNRETMPGEDIISKASRLLKSGLIDGWEKTKLSALLSSIKKTVEEYVASPTKTTDRNQRAAESALSDFLRDMDDKYQRQPKNTENKKTYPSVGIPKNLKIERTYTMSEAALEQRRNAAQQPKPGMLGKRNNYRTGEYSKSILTRIKPCLSTCAKYPCHLVEDGATDAGGDCLDVAHLLHITRAVYEVIQNPENSDNFKEISAASIANSIRILEMLQEDVLRDGSLVKSVKYDKDGNISYEEVKIHPALYAIPKMIADLNMNPEQFMLTPKAKAKQDNEDDAVKSIADLFSAAASQLDSARNKKTGA